MANSSRNRPSADMAMMRWFAPLPAANFDLSNTASSISTRWSRARRNARPEFSLHKPLSAMASAASWPTSCRNGLAGLQIARKASLSDLPSCASDSPCRPPAAMAVDREVRSTLNSRHRQAAQPCLLRATNRHWAQAAGASCATYPDELK